MLDIDGLKNYPSKPIDTAQTVSESTETVSFTGLKVSKVNKII